MDVNKSPVAFEKYSPRKDLMAGEGPHEKTFELYNCFPAIASKYPTKNVNMVPNFDNYTGRYNEITLQKKANAAQIAIFPNKEYNLQKLDIGFIDFQKMMTRDAYTKMKTNPIDKNISGPDIYTHHDNAIKAIDVISKTFEKSRLSPNLRFDN